MKNPLLNMKSVIKGSYKANVGVEPELEPEPKCFESFGSTTQQKSRATVLLYVLVYSTKSADDFELSLKRVTCPKSADDFKLKLKAPLKKETG
jgi:hypothetical protein